MDGNQCPIFVLIEIPPVERFTDQNPIVKKFPNNIAGQGFDHIAEKNPTPERCGVADNYFVHIAPIV